MSDKKQAKRRDRFRKVDSVSDLSKQSHIISDAPASQRSQPELGARQLKRTTSNITSSTPLAYSADSLKLGSSDKGRPEFKTLRSLSIAPSAAELQYEELYEQNNLLRVQGYCLETILDDVDAFCTEDIAQAELEYQEWLQKYFCSRSQDVCHFIPVNFDSNDFVVISVVKHYSSKSDSLRTVRAIISTLEKDEKVTIRHAQLKGSGDSKEGNKSILKGNKLSERKLLAYIRPDLTKKKMKKVSSNQATMDGFLTLARLKLGYLHADRKFKIGVVYWKGQILEEEILSNSEGSPAFNEFIELLGEKSELYGYKGFSGGLDVQKHNDGKHFVHTEWQNSEIVYHVSTLLSGTPQQRKVHIGNDAVIIVFVDCNEPFSPEYISSRFNQVFIVVKIETDENIINKMASSKRSKTRSSSKKRDSSSKRRSTHINKPCEHPSDSTNNANNDVSTEPRDAPNEDGKNSNQPLRHRSASASKDKEEAKEKPAKRKTSFSITPILSSPSSSQPSLSRKSSDTLNGSSSLNGMSTPNIPLSSSPTSPMSPTSPTSSRLSHDRRSALLGTIDKLDDESETRSSRFRDSDRGGKRKGTYYRVSVLRREGVPPFPPALPCPYPVFRKGRAFREFLLSKATTALVASYQSPSFQERIHANRKSFFEKLCKSLQDAPAD